jgi:heptosyltransferase-2
LHDYGEDFKSVIATLKKEKYDYIIDLHNNLRSLRIKKALGIKNYSFNKLNLEKWLFTAFKVNKLPNIHIVDRYLATLSDFGVQNDGKGLDHFIPEGEQVVIQSLPETHQNGYIGLVIGAALATKQLPLSKLEELCHSMHHPIVLLGGKEDEEKGIFLENKFPEKIFNACGKYSLNQSASLVKQARVIVTHDTGMMHIAAAFCKPIVSIWGNTVPAFGMTAYYPNDFPAFHRICEVPGLSCRPCSKIGFKKCPKGHFNCMMQQDIGLIAGKAALFFRLSGFV